MSTLHRENASNRHRKNRRTENSDCHPQKIVLNSYCKRGTSKNRLSKNGECSGLCGCSYAVATSVLSVCASCCLLLFPDLAQPPHPVSLLFAVATAVLFAVVMLAALAPTQTPPVSLLLLSPTLSTERTALTTPTVEKRAESE
jgi:hypothetical protein